MNIETVRRLIRGIEIEALDHDDEVAHTLEDELYLQVLRHHAVQGCPLAKEALKTQDIEFARWCA